MSNVKLGGLGGVVSGGAEALRDLAKARGSSLPGAGGGASPLSALGLQAPLSAQHRMRTGLPGLMQGGTSLAQLGQSAMGLMPQGGSGQGHGLGGIAQMAMGALGGGFLGKIEQAGMGLVEGAVKHSPAGMLLRHTAVGEKVLDAASKGLNSGLGQTVMVAAQTVLPFIGPEGDAAALGLGVVQDLAAKHQPKVE